MKLASAARRSRLLRSPMRFPAPRPKCRRPRARSWRRPTSPGPSARLKSRGLKCRRSRPISVPATAFSACCRPRVCRPQPLRKRWPTRTRRRAPSRKRSSKAAPSTRSRRATAAGSFRSARWKPRARPAAYRSRTQSGPRSAQQGRSVHRAGRRQGQQKAVPRPLRRPGARSGRSGLPDAEARRYFLHYRSQLIDRLT